LQWGIKNDAHDDRNCPMLCSLLPNAAAAFRRNRLAQDSWCQPPLLALAVDPRPEPEEVKLPLHRADKGNKEGNLPPAHVVRHGLVARRSLIALLLEVGVVRACEMGRGQALSVWRLGLRKKATW
jgi:hypothetical protein